MNINDIELGFIINTRYNNDSSKIKAILKHGIDEKTIVNVNCYHAFGSTDNHLMSALVCIDKVMNTHGKKFEITTYAYNNKGDGFCFIVKRVN